MGRVGPRPERVHPRCAASQGLWSDPGLPLVLAFPGSHFLLCPLQVRWAALGSLWALSGERGHSHGNVVLADGELYTGTVSSFQGNDPAISRSQSHRPTKTESSLNWLQGEVLPPPTQ